MKARDKASQSITLATHFWRLSLGFYFMTLCPMCCAAETFSILQVCQPLRRHRDLGRRLSTFWRLNSIMEGDISFHLLKATFT